MDSPAVDLPAAAPDDVGSNPADPPETMEYSHCMARVILCTLSGAANLGVALLYSASVHGALSNPWRHPREAVLLFSMILTGVLSLSPAQNILASDLLGGLGAKLQRELPASPLSQEC